ncbi:MAG: Asparagine synthase, glutamine-hydrolyzing, partial [uncultured bacterium]
SWLPALPSYFRKISRYQLSPKQASILEYSRDIAHAYFISRAIYLPWELETVLDFDLIEAGIKELNLFERMKQDVTGIRSTRFQISALEIQWYMRNQLLRDTDWASMAHSLEVRVPFVDVNFFENSIRLIASHALGKKELACAPHRSLPTTVMQRKKTGFNIPVRQWFMDQQQKGDAKDWLTFIWSTYGR